jgi:uncharacterized membrane protein
MHDIGNYFMESLGVRLPEGYRTFLERYQQKLAEDPISRESWIKGLGNSHFVIGNTQAFRSSVDNFPKESIIIGYHGSKLIKEINEEIDVFVMLDTRTEQVRLIDSFGITQDLAASFPVWVQHRLNEALLKAKYKSTFYAVAFDDVERANEVRKDLLRMQHDHLVDLEDAVVVIRKTSGKIKLKHMQPLTAPGVLGGGLTGLLVGSLLFHPVLGAIMGAVTEMASMVLSNLPSDDEFLKELSSTLKPGTSALFVLVRKADPEKTRAQLEGIGGKVLATSLTEEQEAALQALLNSHKEGGSQSQCC